MTPFDPPSMLFVLKDKMAVRAASVIEWGYWMASNNTVVSQVELDGVLVSTVFLGINHNFYGGEDPLLFETMVFVEGESVRLNRYFTWAEAEAGHAEFIEQLKLQHDQVSMLTASTLTSMAGARAG